MSPRPTNDVAVAPPQVEAGMVTTPETSFAFLPVALISPSKTNSRGKITRESIADLIDSVRRQGVLQPILVRPLEGKRNALTGEQAYELVAGHRRLEAARIAGLAEIPATVRTLTDLEALELQVIENLHRSDLTPLEEAEGYAELKRRGYDAARIAEKIGRSEKYVHDRVKLLALTKDARALLATGQITAGHAILLARLKPADQARAMAEHALFERQELLFAGDDPEDRDDTPRMKARSVREFSDWIEKHVRMDLQQADPVLFPEAREALTGEGRAVMVTYLHYVPEEARDGKTYFPQSWKRADGKQGSKTCSASTLGLVVVGPRRGECFDVCVEKGKCTTHWASEIREKKRRAKEREQALAADAGPRGKAAAEAESPETAARKKALEKALNEAHDTAREAATQALGVAAGALSPDDFIRAFANAMADELANWDRADLTRKTVDAWIAKAPLGQLQRAIAEIQEEYYDDRIFKAFGVDPKAIRQQHIDAARAKFKAEQPAAPAKAVKPAKPAKAGKRAAAAEDEE